MGEGREGGCQRADKQQKKKRARLVSGKERWTAVVVRRHYYLPRFGKRPRGKGRLVWPLFNQAAARLLPIVYSRAATLPGLSLCLCVRFFFFLFFFFFPPLFIKNKQPIEEGLGGGGVSDF
jgi:hypothetical protein